VAEVMMFNFDGQIVAGVLTDQQLGQTFNEIIQSRRNARAAAGPTEQDYVNLLNAHNKLVAQYNRVIENNKQVDERNRKIAADYADSLVLKAQRIGALENDNAELRHSLMLAEKASQSSWTGLCEALQKLRDAGLPE
jgi:hypothetical protein